MTRDDGAVLTWLYDDDMKKKAEIRYRIRQLEAKFFALQLPISQGDKQQLAQKYCNELFHLYLSLLPEQAHEFCLANKESPENSCVNFNALSERIHIIKNTLTYTSLQARKNQLIHEISQCYKALAQFVFAKPSSAYPGANETLSALLKQAAQATTADIWLDFLVRYAVASGESLHALQHTIEILSQDSIIKLARQFEKPEWVSLINAIFVFKLEPQKLSATAFHPEKLVSLKKRLGELYYFIEILQTYLSRRLSIHTAEVTQDFLFHGSELPRGISVEYSEQHVQVVEKALKAWPVCHVEIVEHMRYSDTLDAFFKVYKFWFNPSRLIDTVMSLSCPPFDMMNEAGAKSVLSKHFLPLHAPLSTSDAIDLYGYFTNKDTMYLLRTLRAAAEGEPVSNFIELTLQEKNSMRAVYLRLSGVINALCEELALRRIQTATVEPDTEAGPAKPGQRNLQALYRILTLYGQTDCAAKKTVIDDLFAALEG